MAFVETRIDARDYFDGVEDITLAIRRANEAMRARIPHGIRDIIIGAYWEAVEQAGPGFHNIYANHLLKGIAKNIHVTVETYTNGLTVLVDDIEGLGTKSDLAQGYHYHAIIGQKGKKFAKGEFSVSNPPIVELPYIGQPLYNDYEKRLEVWENIVDGNDVEINFHGHIKFASTEGDYENTLRARVNYWSSQGVYPEWIILEWGTETYPEVEATHFSNYIVRERVYDYLNGLYEEIADSIIDAWEAPGTRTNAAGRLIDARTGRFVKYLPSGGGDE